MAKSLVQPGQLRHTLEVQNFNEQADGEHGEKIGEWKTSARIKAKIEHISESEVEAARQLYALAQYRVTTRYTKLINSTTRLCFDGRIFHVGSINNVELRNRWLVLLCSEAD